VKQLNAAIIGFSLSGRVFHAPFLHTHPGFNLTKIVERSSQKSKEIYPYIQVVKDYQELLQDDDLDLIVIGTPNTWHYPMVKESLLAGKHVVVEKPFTPTVKEADELIEIARKVHRKIFVYHNRRWDGDFLTIQKLINEQKLGEIYEYEAHFDRFTPDLKNNWRDEDKAGSGILYDLGSHLIDQAIQLFGLAKNVKSTIEAQRKNSPVDDYFRLELEYPHTKVILTAGMLVKELGPRFIVKGSKGQFIKYGIDPQEAALKEGQMPDTEDWGKEGKEHWGTLSTNNNEMKIETLAGNYMGFYDNVYEAIVNNEETFVKPEETREVIRIIETAKR